jgi:hypothetical protein
LTSKNGQRTENIKRKDMVSKIDKEERKKMRRKYLDDG